MLGVHQAGLDGYETAQSKEKVKGGLSSSGCRRPFLGEASTFSESDVDEWGLQA
jgi:hypothetical protein